MYMYMHSYRYLYTLEQGEHETHSPGRVVIIGSQWL